MIPDPAAPIVLDTLPFHRVTDEDLRHLRTARDEYLAKDQLPAGLRSVVQRSWMRCTQYRLTPDLRALEVRAEPRLDQVVRRAYAPVLRKLAARIHRTRAAILLTDGAGTIAEWGGDVTVRRRLERVHAAPGGVLSEEATGTNAVGTALEEGVGVQICSGEHFIEAFQGFACTAVPVRHPLTRRILAVLDLTTRDRDVDASVARLTTGAVQAIQRRLVEELTTRERALLFYYLQEPRRAREAIIATDGHTTISSAGTLRLLEHADYAMLFPLMEEGLAASRQFQREVLLTSGQPARLTVTPKFDGGATVGIILHVEPLAPPPPKPAARPVADPFAHLVGASRAFCQAVDAARAAVNSGLSAAVVGEPGTGKYALAEAMAAAHGGHVATVECAVPDRDVTGWINRVRDALGRSSVLIFRHLDALPRPAQRALVGVLADEGLQPLPACVATLQRAVALRRDLWDRIAAVRIALPPLRERREDIPLLARALLSRLQGARPVRVSSAALQVLASAPWPGNVRELENALRCALLAAQGWELTVYDLPDEVVSSVRRPDLARLEQLEAEEIRRALREARGNRVRAAAILGIGRSTLYRKLEAYRQRGLDLDP